MDGLELQLRNAFQALVEAKVPHALIGGLAIAKHGAPRATADIDLLIDEDDKDAATKALVSLGYELKIQTDETAHFAGVGALDLLLARRPITREMLRSAWREGHHELTPAVDVEDIIGLKIQAYNNDPRRRLRDQADIEALITANPTLDWARVKRYAEIFGRWADIEAIQRGLAGSS